MSAATPGLLGHSRALYAGARRAHAPAHVERGRWSAADGSAADGSRWSAGEERPGTEGRLRAVIIRL